MKTLMTLGFLAALAVSAFAQTLPKPAETDFKSAVCAECGMKVTSKSYAAQIVTDGKPLFFDDIGCLVQYQREGKIKAESVKARYVRSVLANVWLPVDSAVWVATKDVRTPMGYGLHAFPDRSAADDFLKAHKKGRIIAWKDAPDTVPAAGKMSGMSGM